MKKTILSLSIIAISFAFSNDINMGESIFNDKSLKDGDYINDSVVLTPKQKALMDIAKRKQKEAEEQIAILEEENAKLQENRNHQENYQKQAYSQEELNLQKNKLWNTSVILLNLITKDRKSVV